MLVIPNCRFIQPFVDELNIVVHPNNDTLADVDGITYPLVPPRSAQYYSYQASSESVITLPWTPIVNEWVEIYLEGFRIVNFTTDFGLNYNPYSIENNIITFDAVITGNVEIYCDNTLQPGVRPSNIIIHDNIQGAEADSPLPDQTFAAIWCEPFVCAQPSFGYVRLTDDRRSLMYIPNQFYVGNDSFSYALISQRGQVSKPKCVFVNVFDPTPPPAPDLDP
jgi:hypothetical protein